jgi:hypothetical protein
MSPDGFDVPIHHGHGEGAPHLLARARQHLAAHDERAAAVYARAACERKLQRYCERNALPVRYHTDPRRIDAQSFWDAAKKKLREEKDQKKLATYESTISQIKTFRKIVLNPLAMPPLRQWCEQRFGAIDAVEALNL